jgi:hypothetical protein
MITLGTLLRWYRKLPREVRVIALVVIVPLVATIILTLYGAVDRAMRFAGVGPLGAVVVLAACAGAAYLAHHRSRSPGILRRRTWGDLLKPAVRDEDLPVVGDRARSFEREDNSRIDLKDVLSVRSKVHQLIASARFDEAERLLNKVKGDFAGETWWGHMKDDITQRRG